MKIGGMEGTNEEIRDFCQNNGLNIEDYLEKPELPLSNIWLIIPSILFVILLGALVFAKPTTSNWQLFIFLLGFASSVWLSVSVLIRFKSNRGAGVIILAGLLIMLVALGVLEPKELLEYYENI